MKTDREKLIELIKIWTISPLPSDCVSGAAMAAHLADYLISKGVTIPVRCSECRYFAPDDWDGETLYGCEFGGVEFDVNPDTYCCYGERKEE